MRPSGRAADQLRPVTLEPGYAKFAEGSCLARFGDTHVLCAATVENRVPSWMRDKGRGWVTAEYGMPPRGPPPLRPGRGRRREGLAAGGFLQGLGPVVVDSHLVTGPGQIESLAQAHGAQAGESDAFFAHVLSRSGCGIISVVA